MKDRAGIAVRYAPLWVILAFFVLLYFTSTAPAIKSGHHLLEVRAAKQEQNRAVQEEIERVENLIRALENDPITVENELRKQLGGARAAGEIGLDRAE